MSASFTGLDVGLPGGSLYPGDARSVVSVLHGGRKIARTSFAFAGVPGIYTHQQGSRGATVVWRLDLRVRTLAILNAIEDAIEGRMETGEGVLTSTTGRQWLRTILKNYEQGRGFETIRSGELTGWVTRTDTLYFEVQI